MRREWLAIAACVGLASALAGAETPEPRRVLDLETLMQHFSQSRGVEAEYREEKALALLDAPIESEGVLYFVPPDRMARFTLEPERASLLLDGDRMRTEDSLGVEEIDLGAQEGVRQFVDQLLLLFRGDLAALRRHYEVGFESEGERWTLRLTPKGLRLRQVMRQITMQGDADRLLRMRMDGGDAETTTTTYGRVVNDRPFAADEIARLFPADGSPEPLPRPDAATP